MTVYRVRYAAAVGAVRDGDVLAFFNDRRTADEIVEDNAHLGLVVDEVEVFYTATSYNYAVDKQKMQKALLKLTPEEIELLGLGHISRRAEEPFIRLDVKKEVITDGAE